MLERIKQILEAFGNKITDVNDLGELGSLRIKYLGKNGEVTELMKGLKSCSADERPLIGKRINEVRQRIEKAISEAEKALSEKAKAKKLAEEEIDVTLGLAHDETVGALHPLTITKNMMIDAFVGMGFEVKEGPEVELDYFNFQLLNIPKDHPSRDMQDTFYIDPNTLLRTHTTAMQMRELEKAKGQLPIKLICPGKVYRRDDDDATHSHQFMQCEGLVVGEHITLADLKGSLEFMADALFGSGRNVRFRPSYFPFTEPSVEVDVSCPFCNGKGCNVCKGSGWIEILGAGMVHPHVLEMNGFDPEKCSGFAFGVGLERGAMLKYVIDDIRNFYTNDIRFLKNFDRFD